MITLKLCRPHSKPVCEVRYVLTVCMRRCADRTVPCKRSGYSSPPLHALSLVHSPSFRLLDHVRGSCQEIKGDHNSVSPGWDARVQVGHAHSQQSCVGLLSLNPLLKAPTLTLALTSHVDVLCTRTDEYCLEYCFYVEARSSISGLFFVALQANLSIVCSFCMLGRGAQPPKEVFGACMLTRPVHSHRSTQFRWGSGL